MSDFNPNIRAFCCHYTSQQASSDHGEGLKQAGFPGNVVLDRLTCTGKLQVSTLLAAFEQGADAVYVVGCPPDGCHNVKGSQRAAKRVGAVKKALAELAVEPERVRMYHLERGLHPEFVAAAREMDTMTRALGPCPFNGESR
ncbi:MAG: hydrogenase iron-sulfur subunit [Desulfobacterales bacterium]|nr:hydrogenase iron-sulfur subunit [Desulfobacterales bacterium]